MSPVLPNYTPSFGTPTCNACPSLRMLPVPTRYPPLRPPHASHFPPMCLPEKTSALSAPPKRILLPSFADLTASTHTVVCIHTTARRRTRVTGRAGPLSGLEQPALGLQGYRMAGGEHGAVQEQACKTATLFRSACMLHHANTKATSPASVSPGAPSPGRGAGTACPASCACPAGGT